MFFQLGVHNNFAIFPGKHLCCSPFFNKVATLMKKRLQHRCFPVNFAKVLRVKQLQQAERFELTRKYEIIEQWY